MLRKQPCNKMKTVWKSGDAELFGSRRCRGALAFRVRPRWDGRYMLGQGRVLVDGLVVEEECGVADGAHEVAA